MKTEKRIYQPVISGASKVSSRLKMGSEGAVGKEVKLLIWDGVELGSGISAGGKLGISQRTIVCDSAALERMRL